MVRIPPVSASAKRSLFCPGCARFADCTSRSLLPSSSRFLLVSLMAICLSVSDTSPLLGQGRASFRRRHDHVPPFPQCAAFPPLRSVLCRGQNQSGQCGVDLAGLILRPRQVPSLNSEPPADLFAGYGHSAIITQSNEVLVWGSNVFGELGVGRSQTLSKPSTIPVFRGQQPIRTLAMGNEHVLFADETGGLWSSGSNKYGQLGLGVPIPVTPQNAHEAEGQAVNGERSVPVVVMMRQMDHRVRLRWLW